jgi:hypothetical protein
VAYPHGMLLQYVCFASWLCTTHLPAASCHLDSNTTLTLLLPCMYCAHMLVRADGMATCRLLTDLNLNATDRPQSWTLMCTMGMAPRRSSTPAPMSCTSAFTSRGYGPIRVSCLAERALPGPIFAVHAVEVNGL